MKTHLPLLILALLAISMLAPGCGQEPFIPPTPIPTLAPATLPAATPTPVPSAEGEPAGPEDPVQAGRQVFEQTCAVCHNLTTETKVGPGLAGLFDRDQLPSGKPVNEENLKEWIVTGGGAMPGLPLTEEQLAVLVAFLKEATQP